MTEPSAKKRKTAVNADEPRITDSRFANIQSDPRFRLPGKGHKVKLDKRFARVLKDEEFSRKAKVDRYGRPLEADAGKKRLKRKYEFEEEEEGSQSDEPDADEEVQKELQRFDKAHDPLREGRDTGSSSSSEGSSDEESDYVEIEEAELAGDEQSNVPLGEVTSRIAVVNLDWDNIRAEDLMMVFSSQVFLASIGRLTHVAVYPSEFGKERMQREELEGPPKDIFAVNREFANPDSDEDDEDDEQIKASLLKPDDGAEFNSQALRSYQLDRLRYFYAVLTFSSPEAAKMVYDAVDGTEYLSTANFFDLRFVPEDTDFSSDEPREECNAVPAGYKPSEFVTDALQHSKVKLTWDAEDNSRKDAVTRAFKGGRKEIEENDLKAYLASDSSGSEDEVENEEADQGTKVLSKKDIERQKMRALLGLSAESEKRSSKSKDKAPLGGIQVTFSAGLSGNNANDENSTKQKRSVFENSPEPEETTVEKYARKEKERKQKRKDRMKASREGNSTSTADQVNSTTDDVPAASDTTPAQAEEGDLGFDDPFFVEPSATETKSASNKTRKEDRLRKRREREAEEAAEQKQRAELELLMADDQSTNLAQNNNNTKSGSKSNGHSGMRHFDMKEIEKREKEAKKKEKKQLKKSAKKHDKQNNSNDNDNRSDDIPTSTPGNEVEDGMVEDQAGFKVDTTDPRFARLFENHEYAIDPTNPRYKATRGMQRLLDEGRKRKAKKDRR